MTNCKVIRQEMTRRIEDDKAGASMVRPDRPDFLNSRVAFRTAFEMMRLQADPVVMTTASCQLCIVIARDIVQGCPVETNGARSPG
jgi:hypothetical protein